MFTRRGEMSKNRDLMQRLPTIQYDGRIATHGDPDLLTFTKEAVLPYRVRNPRIYIFVCQIKGLLQHFLCSSRSSFP